MALIQPLSELPRLSSRNFLYVNIKLDTKGDHKSLLLENLELALILFIFIICRIPLKYVCLIKA